MELTYLYWITFKYTKSFEGTFEHGFYSKSADPRYVTRTANNYMKKHHIPAEIIEVKDPEMKLLIKR